MKKILVTTILTGAFALSTFAQGIITFSAPSARPIKFSTDGATSTAVAAGNPATVAGYGNVNVALYGAALGTQIQMVGGVPDLSAWKLMTTAPISKLIAAGYIGGTACTMDAALGAAGTKIQAIVVGWTGSAANFAAAVAQGNQLLGWSGSALSGGALGWGQDTGTSLTPVVVATGAGAFNGLVLAPIPEPSTFALAGLGAAALLIFRRRK